MSNGSCAFNSNLIIRKIKFNPSSICLKRFSNYFCPVTVDAFFWKIKFLGLRLRLQKVYNPLIFVVFVLDVLQDVCILLFVLLILAVLLGVCIYLMFLGLWLRLQDVSELLQFMLLLLVHLWSVKKIFCYIKAKMK